MTRPTGIIALQRSIAEAGRIRIGRQVPASSGRGSRPTKLETFRLTSSDRQRIEQAAAAYGGKVAEWQAPAGKQWEVITERDALDVVVPPEALSFSQAYELWSAGGCQRRCDGITESQTGEPRACLCDPAARECDIHTRLSVLLRDLPGLGVWRLDTQGYYAATELLGAMEIIRIAAGTALLPARLRLDQRSVKRPDDKGKPQTLRFAVPVLDIEVTPATLLAGGQGQPLELATAPRSLTPVPALDTGEGRTIAQQSEPPGPAPRRANSAAPIPSSGRRRGARAETAQPELGPAGEEKPADGGHPAEAVPSGGDSSDEAAPAGDGSPAGARSRSCTHPADQRRQFDDGTACGKCGAVLDETPPAEAKEPKDSSGPGYWQARLHAVAGERSIDHDGLRSIVAAVKGIAPDALDGFSLRDLDDATAEGIDKLLRQFPEGLDLDGATEWVAKVAERRGLSSWTEIDPLAAAAHPSIEEATIADWLTFGLRLHRGEYDAPAEADPTPPARSRRASQMKETTDADPAD